MTREEAIKAIQDFIGWFKSDSRIYKALEMAIQAISQVAICPSVGVNCEDCPAYEPCDAVSREAVCEIISDIRDCISVEGYWAILERLKKLQPVTQKPETVTEFADRCRECGARYGKLLEQKSGKWVDTNTQDSMTGKVFKCDKCGEDFIKDYNYNYCPNCGAKMESEA